MNRIESTLSAVKGATVALAGGSVWAAVKFEDFQAAVLAVGSILAAFFSWYLSRRADQARYDREQRMQEFLLDIRKLHAVFEAREQAKAKEDKDLIQSLVETIAHNAVSNSTGSAAAVHVATGAAAQESGGSPVRQESTE